MRSDNGVHPLNKYRLTLFGLSALWIYYFHFGNETFYNVSFLQNIKQFIQKHGYLGVDIFVFLSAIGLETLFVNTKTFSFQFLRHYYTRRLSRIYSVYLPFTVIKTIFRNNFSLSCIKLLCFYPNITQSMYSNHWFVPTILCYYLFAPFYWQLFLHSKNKVRCTCGFVSFFLLAQSIFGPIIRRDIICIFNRIPVFILGFNYGHSIRNNSTYKRNGNWISVITIILSSFLIIICDRFAVRIRTINPIYLVQLVAIPALIQLISSLFEYLDSKVLGHLLVLFLNKIGTMSLPVYLLGSLLHNQTRNFRIPHQQKEFGLFLVTIITACGLQESFGSLHKINHVTA